MQDPLFTSRMFTCAGVLMSISGILMVIGARIANGGVFFGAAVCMFTAAYHFRGVQDQKEPESREAESGTAAEKDNIGNSSGWNGEET